jgi:hypothetical protein
MLIIHFENLSVRETWFLAVREKYEVHVFSEEVLRKYEVSEHCRNLHNEELNYSY